MSANRFFTLLVLLALALVVLLTAQEAVATAALTSEVDSATRSYTSWAHAEEVEGVDSATRSYAAWIRDVVCAADPTNGAALDSATRSYIAWARHMEVGEACG
jgi:hypothetical protein